jgi:hypothetical protein
MMRRTFVHDTLMLYKKIVAFVSLRILIRIQDTDPNIFEHRYGSGKNDNTDQLGYCYLHKHGQG